MSRQWRSPAVRALVRVTAWFVIGGSGFLLLIGWTTGVPGMVVSAALLLAFGWSMLWFRTKAIALISEEAGDIPPPVPNPWMRFRRLPVWGQAVGAVAVLVLLVTYGSWDPAVEGGSAAPTADVEASPSPTEASAPELEPEPDPEPEPGPEPEAVVADPSGDLVVSFVDVGQGDATLLAAPDVTVLVDTGRHDRSEVVAYLRGRGVDSIDVVIVTHPHADHLGQFDKVLSTFEVAEVWWSPATHDTATFERAVAALEASSAVFGEPRAGDVTAVGSLLFEFVNPDEAADPNDLHDTSLAFRVTYGGVRFLFTGDAERHTEQRMVRNHGNALAADVYQVGHHGAATSTSPALLDATSPDVAVYSAGAGNQYGHPHDEVIHRLNDAGVAVYGTDVHGTVTVTSDGNTYAVSAEHQAEVVTTLPATEPEPKPQPEPEPPAAPVPADLSVTFTSVTSPVRAGSYATATVSAAPGAQCNITVTYKSGPSSAEGLGPMAADGNGSVSWTWQVGSRTTKGDWPIDVSCTLDGQRDSARTHFTVS